jgi:hypothetical protein
MSRSAASLVAALLLLAIPARALAWDDVREVIHGSSRTLERGEMKVGIITPLAYGIHDRVTLFIHPALLLLLTPAVWLRVAALDKAAGLAFEMGYQQSWLKTDTSDRPGFLQAGIVYSQAIKKSGQLTLAVGYLAEFGRAGIADQWLGLYWRVGANILIGANDMLLADIRGVALVGEGHRIPSGSLIYAHQFGRLRLGAGASFGRFPISSNFSGSAADDESVPLYAYPWFDLWWRF